MWCNMYVAEIFEIVQICVLFVDHIFCVDLKSNMATKEAQSLT